MDPNIEEDVLSDAEFELNIDVAEVAAVKNTSKKKKKQGCQKVPRMKIIC